MGQKSVFVFFYQGARKAVKQFERRLRPPPTGAQGLAPPAKLVLISVVLVQVAKETRKHENFHPEKTPAVILHRYNAFAMLLPKSLKLAHPVNRPHSSDRILSVS